MPPSPPRPQVDVNTHANVDATVRTPDANVPKTTGLDRADEVANPNSDEGRARAREVHARNAARHAAKEATKPDADPHVQGSTSTSVSTKKKDKR
jgi:hypothetical protein